MSKLQRYLVEAGSLGASLSATPPLATHALIFGLPDGKLEAWSKLVGKGESHMTLIFGVWENSRLVAGKARRATMFSHLLDCQPLCLQVELLAVLLLHSDGSFARSQIFTASNETLQRFSLLGSVPLEQLRNLRKLCSPWATGDPIQELPSFRVGRRRNFHRWRSRLGGPAGDKRLTR